jgi:hypothetical protein
LVLPVEIPLRAPAENSIGLPFLLQFEAM